MLCFVVPVCDEFWVLDNNVKHVSIIVISLTEKVGSFSITTAANKKAT
jgi:hypothetical protein